MTEYVIDTRCTEAALSYADGSTVMDWEISGEPNEPEFLTISSHGVALVVVTIEADGRILLDVHEETPLHDAAGLDTVGPWLDLHAVAERLGIAYDTVKAYRSRGGFPKPDRRFGKAPVWRPSSIDKWKNRNQ